MCFSLNPICVITVMCTHWIQILTVVTENGLHFNMVCSTRFKSMYVHWFNTDIVLTYRGRTVDINIAMVELILVSGHIQGILSKDLQAWLQIPSHFAIGDGLYVWLQVVMGSSFVHSSQSGINISQIKLINKGKPINKGKRFAGKMIMRKLINEKFSWMSYF